MVTGYTVMKKFGVSHGARSRKRMDVGDGSGIVCVPGGLLATVKYTKSLFYSESDKLKPNLRACPLTTAVR